MKFIATQNVLIQGLILSLTTQLALSLLTDSTSQRSPSGQGNLYRSAPIKATQDKDSAAVYAPNQRGQRCIRCATGQNSYYGGNSADRLYDDYYRSYAYPASPQSYGREDRNWYYQPERYNDDRYRYGSYNDRYDDRYYSRNMDPLYDNYYNEQRSAYNPNYNNYNYNNYNARGNGYDNTNPAYYEQMRERFNRDRNNYGYERGYENTRGGYPAQVYRGMEGGYYDNRNYRPYDETYRGQSGFDNSGRGYYWANEREQQPQHQQPQHHQQQEKPYREHQQSTANRHHSYSQAQKPQQNNPNYYNSHSNNNNNNNNNAQQHTSSGIAPEYYQVKQSHNTPSNVQTVSSNAIGVDTGGNANANSSDRWSNKDNKDSNDNSKDLDKEKASPSYGVRPQSLGTSYLYDRNNDGINDGSPASVPAANAAISASNDDKKQESANLQMKEE